MPENPNGIAGLIGAAGAQSIPPSGIGAVAAQAATQYLEQPPTSVEDDILKVQRRLARAVEADRLLLLTNESEALKRKQKEQEAEALIGAYTMTRAREMYPGVPDQELTGVAQLVRGEAEAEYEGEKMKAVQAVPMEVWNNLTEAANYQIKQLPKGRTREKLSEFLRGENNRISPEFQRAAFDAADGDPKQILTIGRQLFDQYKSAYEAEPTEWQKGVQGFSDYLYNKSLAGYAGAGAVMGAARGILDLGVFGATLADQVAENTGRLVKGGKPRPWNEAAGSFQEAGSQFKSAFLPEVRSKDEKELSFVTFDKSGGDYARAVIGSAARSAGEFLGPAAFMGGTSGVFRGAGARVATGLETSALNRALSTALSRGSVTAAESLAGNATAKALQGAAAVLRSRVGKAGLGYLDNIIATTKAAYPSVFSNYYEEMRRRGFDETEAAEKAHERATVNILLESLGNPLQRNLSGRGAATTLLDGSASRTASGFGQVVRAATEGLPRFLGKGAQEGGEEFVQGLADHYQDFTEGKLRWRQSGGLEGIPPDEKFDWSKAATNAANDAVVGFVSGAMMGASSRSNWRASDPQAEALFHATANGQDFARSLTRMESRGTMSTEDANRLRGFVARMEPLVAQSAGMGFSPARAVRHAVATARLQDLSAKALVETDPAKAAVLRLAADEAHAQTVRISKSADVDGRLVSGQEMLEIAQNNSPKVSPLQARRIVNAGPYESVPVNPIDFAADPRVKFYLDRLGDAEAESAKNGSTLEQGASDYSGQGQANYADPVIDDKGGIIDGARRIALALAQGRPTLTVSRPLAVEILAERMREEAEVSLSPIGEAPVTGDPNKDADARKATSVAAEAENNPLQGAIDAARGMLEEGADEGGVKALLAQSMGISSVEAEAIVREARKPVQQSVAPPTVEDAGVEIEDVVEEVLPEAETESIEETPTFTDDTLGDDDTEDRDAGAANSDWVQLAQVEGARGSEGGSPSYAPRFADVGAGARYAFGEDERATSSPEEEYYNRVLELQRGKSKKQRRADVLAHEPRSFREFVLQRLVAGLRIQTSDFVRYTGLSNPGKEGYLGRIKKDGEKLDLFVHDNAERFNIAQEDEMDAMNDAIELLMAHPGSVSALESLEEMIVDELAVRNPDADVAGDLTAIEQLSEEEIALLEDASDEVDAMLAEIDGIEFTPENLQAATALLASYINDDRTIDWDSIGADMGDAMWNSLPTGIQTYFEHLLTGSERVSLQGQPDAVAERLKLLRNENSSESERDGQPFSTGTGESNAQSSSTEGPGGSQEGTERTSSGRSTGNGISFVGDTTVFAERGWTPASVQRLTTAFTAAFSTRKGIGGDVRFVVMDTEAMRASLAEEGFEGLVPPNGIALPGEDGGYTIYINAEKATPETALHEAGHIWRTWARSNAPQLYDAGLRIVEASPLFKALAALYDLRVFTPEGFEQAARSDDSIQKLLKTAKGDLGQAMTYAGIAFQQYGEARDSALDMLADETLALAIETEGANLGSNLSGFTTWLNKLFEAIAKAVGFTGRSAQEVAKMKLDEFARRIATEISQGRLTTIVPREAVDEFAEFKDLVTNREELRRRNAGRPDDLDNTFDDSPDSTGLSTTGPAAASSVESTLSQSTGGITPSAVWAVVERVNPGLADNAITAAMQTEAFSSTVGDADPYPHAIKIIVDTLGNPKSLSAEDAAILGTIGVAGRSGKNKATGIIADMLSTMADALSEQSEYGYTPAQIAAALRSEDTRFQIGEQRRQERSRQRGNEETLAAAMVDLEAARARGEIRFSIPTVGATAPAINQRMSRFGLFLREWMSPGGGVSQPFIELMEQSGGWTQGQMDEVSKLRKQAMEQIADFAKEQQAKPASLRVSERTISTAYNNALEGKPGAIALLPVELQATVRAQRDVLNAMQELLAKSGFASPKLKKTIEETSGTYVARNYKMFAGQKKFLGLFPGKHWSKEIPDAVRERALEGIVDWTLNGRQVEVDGEMKTVYGIDHSIGADYQAALALEQQAIANPIDSALNERAKQELEDVHARAVQAAHEYMDRLEKESRGEGENTYFVSPTGNRMKVKDFQKRKDLPLWYREYLGEVSDPIDRFMLTAGKLIRANATAQLQAQIRDFGLSTGDIIAPRGIKPKGFKTVGKMDSDPRFEMVPQGALNGHHLHPLLYNALFGPTIDPSWYYSNVALRVKIGKVILSPVGIVKNAFSNKGFLIANGTLSAMAVGGVTNAGYAAAAWKKLGGFKAYKKRVLDDAMKYGLINSTDGNEIRDYLGQASRAGAVEKAFQRNGLAAWYDLFKGDNPNNRSGADFLTLQGGRVVKGLGGAASAVGKGAMKVAEKSFAWGDIAPKVGSFEVWRNYYAKTVYDQRFYDLTEEQQEASSAAAAAHTKATMVTDSRVIKGASAVQRKVGILGTFPRFMVESHRTFYNIVGIASGRLRPARRGLPIRFFEDEAQNAAALKKIGRHTQIHSLVGLAGWAGLLQGLYSMAALALGDEDDNIGGGEGPWWNILGDGRATGIYQAFRVVNRGEGDITIDEAIRTIVPSYSKNNMLLYKIRGDGEIEVWDTGSNEPFNSVISIGRAFMFGGAGATGEALAEAGKSVFGPEMLANAVFEHWANKDDYGRGIYTPSREWADQAKDIFSHYMRKAAPGFVVSGMQVYRATNEQGRPLDEALMDQAEKALVGSPRIYKMDDVLRGAAYQTNLSLRSAKASMKRDLRRGDEQEVIDAEGLRIRARDVAKLYDFKRAATMLGLKDDDAQRVIKESGLPKDVQRAVLLGGDALTELQPFHYEPIE